MDWPSMSPALNPIEHLCGILKWKVEERKVSNIHQLRDVIMEEWKRTKVATCEALVNSMPKRVKAVLENNGGTHNIHTLGPIWTFSLRGVLTFVASSLDINGCVLSYFEGTANLHCYTSCTLTTLHCSKVSFLQCCHMKIYNKIFTKMWGVYSLLWDTVCIYIYIYIYVYNWFTPLFLFYNLIIQRENLETWFYYCLFMYLLNQFVLYCFHFFCLFLFCFINLCRPVFVCLFLFCFILCFVCFTVCFMLYFIVMACVIVWQF